MDETEALLPDSYYTQVSIILYFWSEYGCDSFIVEEALNELFNDAVFIFKLMPIIEQYVQLPEDKINTAFLMSMIERSDFVKVIKEFDLPDIESDAYWIKGSEIYNNQDKIVYHIKKHFAKSSNIENFSHNMNRILSDD
jgi:hypothetical protein